MKQLVLSRNGILVPAPAPKPVQSASIITNKNPAHELDRLNKILSGSVINISVIRSGGGIGDVLMTFPTVKALKKKYNCKLTYVTDFDYLGGALKKLAEHNPHIDEIIDYRNFNDAHYDIVINLTCPCIEHEIPKAPPIHRIDLFARSCGLTPLDDSQIDYTVTKEEAAWGEEFLYKRNLIASKTILVQPYASNPRRSYDIKRLQKSLVLSIQQNPQIKFLVLKHSSDFEKDIQWDFKNVYMMKDYDIVSIASVLHHMPMVVCPDSALLHMAGALSKKIVAFFGPTDYRARMYPHMKALCPGEVMPCFPMWYQGDDRLAQESWRMLSPEMLASAIVERYNAPMEHTITSPRIKIESI